MNRDVNPRSEVRLTVQPNDMHSVGRNTARLAWNLMRHFATHPTSRGIRPLDIDPGDVVELTGERTTVARVSPTDHEEVDIESVELDEFTRENAGVAVDETVEVRPTTVEDAISLTLQSSADRPLSLDGETVAWVGELLYKRALVEGDSIPIPEKQSDDAAITYSTLRVVETDPAGPVRVTSTTDIEMRDRTGNDSYDYQRRRDYSY